jgi:16S rRNA (uracil1498-N3)-methyltransferase
MADRPRRLFAPELPEPGAELELLAATVDHARVLRLAEGDRVQLFDGRLGEADARVVRFGREGLRCCVEARRQLPAPAPALHLVLGLPKGRKLDDIARSLAELGVSSLWIALCERSVPRPADMAARMGRLGRIALEACAQSGQPLALALHGPLPLAQAAAEAPAHAARLVFWERATAPLDSVLARAPQSAPQELWAIIGPEGGLAASEVEALTAQGWQVVGLGPGILRVETAAPVISGLLLDRLSRLR